MYYSELTYVVRLMWSDWICGQTGYLMSSTKSFSNSILVFRNTAERFWTRETLNLWTVASSYFYSTTPKRILIPGHLPIPCDSCLKQIFKTDFGSRYLYFRFWQLHQKPSDIGKPNPKNSHTIFPNSKKRWQKQSGKLDTKNDVGVEYSTCQIFGNFVNFWYFHFKIKKTSSSLQAAFNYIVSVCRMRLRGGSRHKIRNFQIIKPGPGSRNFRLSLLPIFNFLLYPSTQINAFKNRYWNTNVEFH